MASSTSKCRGCLNKTNSFCYLCGDFTTVAHRRTITSLLRTAYFHYFGVILAVKLVIRTSLGLHTSVVNPATMD